ncbi:MAG: hypothetical protein LBT64_02715 [Puniceicoccales bacterium]|nr:hypothetical protein [Puniceicoccales bacterium]
MNINFNFQPIKRCNAADWSNYSEEDMDFIGDPKTNERTEQLAVQFVPYGAAAQQILRANDGQSMQHDQMLANQNAAVSQWPQMQCAQQQISQRQANTNIFGNRARGIFADNSSMPNSLTHPSQMHDVATWNHQTGTLQASPFETIQENQFQQFQRMSISNVPGVFQGGSNQQ